MSLPVDLPYDDSNIFAKILAGQVSTRVLRFGLAVRESVALPVFARWCQLALSLLMHSSSAATALRAHARGASTSLYAARRRSLRIRLPESLCSGCYCADRIGLPARCRSHRTKSSRPSTPWPFSTRFRSSRATHCFSPRPPKSEERTSRGETQHAQR